MIKIFFLQKWGLRWKLQNSAGIEFFAFILMIFSYSHLNKDKHIFFGTQKNLGHLLLEFWMYVLAPPIQSENQIILAF